MSGVAKRVRLTVALPVTGQFEVHGGWGGPLQEASHTADTKRPETRQDLIFNGHPTRELSSSQAQALTIIMMLVRSAYRRKCKNAVVKK